MRLISYRCLNVRFLYVHLTKCLFLSWGREKAEESRGHPGGLDLCLKCWDQSTDRQQSQYWHRWYRLHWKHFSSDDDPANLKSWNAITGIQRYCTHTPHPHAHTNTYIHMFMFTELLFPISGLLVSSVQGERGLPGPKGKISFYFYFFIKSKHIPFFLGVFNLC